MFWGNNGLVYCRVRRLSSADPAKEAIFRTFWKAPSKNSISTRSSSEEHGMSVCSCMHACSSRESLARMRIYLDSYTSISCSISNAGRPILICCGWSPNAVSCSQRLIPRPRLLLHPIRMLPWGAVADLRLIPRPRMLLRPRMLPWGAVADLGRRAGLISLPSLGQWSLPQAPPWLIVARRVKKRMERSCCRQAVESSKWRDQTHRSCAESHSRLFHSSKNKSAAPCFVVWSNACCVLSASLIVSAGRCPGRPI